MEHAQEATAFNDNSESQVGRALSGRRGVANLVFYDAVISPQGPEQVGQSCRRMRLITPYRDLVLVSARLHEIVGGLAS